MRIGCQCICYSITILIKIMFNSPVYKGSWVGGGRGSLEWGLLTYQAMQVCAVLKMEGKIFVTNLRMDDIGVFKVCPHLPVFFLVL